MKRSALKPSAKSMKRGQPKLITCKGCRKKKEPFRLYAKVCSIACSETFARLHAEKEARSKAKEVRKIDAARREKIKTRSDYIKEAQFAFNSYIRERDKAQRCICCVDRQLPRPQTGGAYDCGHYRSIGSAPHLRFDERNAHAQTKQCNRYGAGRAVDYRIGLIKRIGKDAVESLEADQSGGKWTIEELKAIRDKYRLKLKELKK